MEEFIYNLNSKNIVNPSYFTDNKVSGLSNFFKALVFILPAVYFLYRYFLKNEKKEFKSIDDVNEYVNQQDRNSAITSILQGIIFIIFGIKLFFFYYPSKSEISLGILIKYLQKKKIISDDFYNIIKKLKPEGMYRFGD